MPSVSSDRAHVSSTPSMESVADTYSSFETIGAASSVSMDIFGSSSCRGCEDSSSLEESEDDSLMKLDKDSSLEEMFDDSSVFEDKGEETVDSLKKDSSEEMADSSVVWGMLPFPKYNKDGEYGSYISDDAVVLCIPEYAADDRMSGDLIEALFASSTEYIKYDFLYHNMLDVLRDNGSVNSLNVIMNNPNYDFVIAMRSGYPTLYSNTAGAFSDLISKELTIEKYKEKEAEVTEYSEKWFPVMYK